MRTLKDSLFALVVWLVAIALEGCIVGAPGPGAEAPVVANPYQINDDSAHIGYVVRYDPPPIYRHWWDQIVACTGRRPTVPFDDLRFFLVGTPTGVFEVRPGVWLYAAHDYRRVVNVLVAGPVVMRADIVRHEFVHVVTSPTRYQSHPDSIFRGACDSLVYHAP